MNRFVFLAIAILPLPLLMGGWIGIAEGVQAGAFAFGLTLSLFAAIGIAGYGLVNFLNKVIDKQ